MPFLKRDSANISYDSAGESDWPALFLINGHTRSSGDFRMMVRHLTEHRIRSVIFDNRGAGRTEYQGSFGIDDMVGDVIALADELEVSKFSALGISMGGFIAQKLAAGHPERVAKLILVSTTASSRFYSTRKIPWSDQLDQVREKLASYFAPNFSLRNSALFETMVKQTHKAIVEGDYLERARAQRSAVDGQELETGLIKIKCPTLIIHGEADQIIMADAARDLNQKILNSKLIIYPEIGHLLLAEASKKLYQDVTGFLLT